MVKIFHGFTIKSQIRNKLDFDLKIDILKFRKYGTAISGLEYLIDTRISVVNREMKFYFSSAVKNKLILLRRGKGD